MFVPPRAIARPTLLASIALAAFALIAATAAPLAVGAAAPALPVSTWVKGEPVKSFEPGKVYVVEFWATWCGPCVRGIPKLVEIQKKHKDDLVVIGVAAFEKPMGTDDEGRLQRLRTWLGSRGSSINYRIAYDAPCTTGKSWMTAAGQRGIPCAFIVNHEGRIAYIGSPSNMDAALNAALKKARASAESKPKKAPDGSPSDRSKDAPTPPSSTAPPASGG